jgi:hypothetical protein
MVDIIIHYKPNRFLPWGKNIKVTVPIKWDELSENQVITLLYFHAGKLENNELIKVLLNIGLNILKRINNKQKKEILDYLTDILNFDHVKKFAIKNLASLKAPGSNLERVTYGAFMLGDMYHQSYYSYGGFNHDLNRFIVCFYSDDPMFNEKLIFKYTQVIFKEDLAVRRAIAINYEFIKNELQQNYPILFGAAKEMERGRKLKDGFIQILFMLDHYNVIEKEKFKKLPVTRALSYLNDIFKAGQSDPGKLSLYIKAWSNKYYN